MVKQTCYPDEGDGDILPPMWQTLTPLFSFFVIFFLLDVL
jgi:hypothetical protein